MSDVNTLLNQRLNKGVQSSKMVALSKQSANGNLTGFSGIFSVVDLSAAEKNCLEEILKEHLEKANTSLKEDLHLLISITSEVKAINNQAAMLHGERIKKAQLILTRYRDGAFTSWLLAAYGNRQTPYNFLQYYEFYETMPKPLRPQIEAMPKQAIYTLASREGAFEKKQEIIEGYQGQTKQELLTIIREIFPLASKDKRRENNGDKAIEELKKVFTGLSKNTLRLSSPQKKAIHHLLEKIQSLISL